MEQQEKIEDFLEGDKNLELAGNVDKSILQEAKIYLSILEQIGALLKPIVIRSPWIS